MIENFNTKMLKNEIKFDLDYIYLSKSWNVLYKIIIYRYIKLVNAAFA